MASLKDWKAALSSGVSVRSLLGLPEGYQRKPGKSGKRKLAEEVVVQPSTSGESHMSSSKADDPDHESTSDFEEFEENLKVTGFLNEPSHFKWSSIPVNEIVRSEGEYQVHPPVPSIPLNQLLGPCFIGVRPKSAETDESASSDG